MTDELANLLASTADKVERWASLEVWTPESGSPGDSELRNAESGPAGVWGERPVRSTFAHSQMAVNAVVQHARAVATLIDPPRTSLALDVLARGALEASAIAWWLLEPKLGARRRVCRMQLLRVNSARELAKAIAEAGADPALIGGETVADVQKYSADLGIGAFADVGSVGNAQCEGEVRPGYTKRVKDLTDDWGFDGAYSIYSGMAHAELYGFWRMYKPIASDLASKQTIHSIGPDDTATFAAANATLLALIAPMERAQMIFGWPAPGTSEEIGATIDSVNEALARLHP